MKGETCVAASCTGGSSLEKFWFILDIVGSSHDWDDLCWEGSQRGCCRAFSAGNLYSPEPHLQGTLQFITWDIEQAIWPCASWMQPGCFYQHTATPECPPKWPHTMSVVRFEVIASQILRWIPFLMQSLCEGRGFSLCWPNNPFDEDNSEVDVLISSVTNC